MAKQNESRKRSVDNLQRVFTVVISLAITEALRRVSTAFQTNSPVPLSEIVAVLALIFTVIPFYHGANRYLDATYVLGQRKAKSQALMVDFVAIFIEGLVFYILATLIENETAFFTFLALLYFFDAIWVGLTRITSEGPDEPGANYALWAGVNSLAAILLLVFYWSNLFNWEFWVNKDVRTIASGVVAVLRTIFDYVSVWDFYYPPPSSDEYIMPVPRPARPNSYFKARKIKRNG